MRADRRADSGVTLEVVPSLILATCGLFIALLACPPWAAYAEDPVDPNDRIELICLQEDAYDGRFGVPTPQFCDAVEGAFESRCWAYPWSEPDDRPPAGYPSRIDLRDAIGPADFPPKSTDPVLTSCPLVSSDQGMLIGPNPAAERPMHNGVVDLITGAALYQETDFELPFGSAVFRHIRTHGAKAWGPWEIPNEIAAPEKFWYSRATNPRQWFWDWNGLMWMMGEQPILLIDASYPNVAQQGTQICYFIPDAHHSVPFVKEDTQNGLRYRAPAWMDVTMQQRPESGVVFYDIWTHRGTVKYTFRAAPCDLNEGHEDLWDYLDDPQDANSVRSVHDPDGYGLPCIALIDSITDQYGHEIRYHYCDFEQFDDDDPDTAECRECAQNCNQKGRIAYIELVAPSDTGEDIVWTLVYTYREFAVGPALDIDPNDPAACDDPYGGTRGMPAYDQESDPNYCHENPLLFGTMLHSIHAYEGELTAPPTCRSVGWEKFADIESFDDYDLVDELDVSVIVEEDDIPDNWVLRTRYMYDEPGGECRYYSEVAPGSPYRAAWNAYAVVPDNGQNLLKASVTRRENGEEHTTRSVYRVYDNRYTDGHRGGNSDLGFVFHDDTINAIAEGMEWTNADPANRLFELYETAEVTVPDGEGGTVRKKFRDVADLVIDRWSANSQAECAEFYLDDGVGSTNIEKLASSVGLDPISISPGSLHIGSGFDCVRDFHDRRAGNKRYLIANLRQYPEAHDTQGYCEYEDWPVYRWPYRYYSGSEMELKSADGVHPFHVTVIEEFDVDPDVDVSSDPNEPDLVEEQYTRRSRRCVGINMAGFVVWDRKWTFEDDGSTTYIQSGFGEEFSYDALGRKTERRTTGWSVANAEPNAPPYPETEGLVYFFEYEDPPLGVDPNDPNNPDAFTELARIGVKKGVGDNQLEIDIERFRHEDTERPELVTQQWKSPDPSDPNAGPVICITREYGYDPQSTADPKPVIWEKVTSTAGPITHLGDPVKYVQLKTFDNLGRPSWTGQGTYNQNGDKLQFTPTQLKYDRYGRKEFEAVDPLDTTDIPDGFARKAGADPNYPPANLITEYDYGSIRGLWRVIHPNERETHIRYSHDPNDSTLLQQWVFKDAVLVDGGYRLLSPITVNVLRGSELQTSYTVKRTGVYAPYPPHPNDHDGWEADIIASTSPEYDANGQMTGMNSAGADGQSVGASFGYHYSGQPAWQQTPDGTITRNVYDQLARLKKTFRGTMDDHPYWHTVPPGDPNAIADDMVLIEKRYYGDDDPNGVTPHNVNQLVQVRRYRSDIGDAYNPDPNDPLEDRVGGSTHYFYDWRMRQVRSEQCDNDGETLSHAVTWYDNLDRARFTAEFDDDPDLTGIDPVEADPTQLEPNAATILGAAGLISLNENVYNRAGLVEESRQYFVDPNSAFHGDYLSTFTYYDHRGKPIEVRAPNSPVRKYSYDGKGRQIRSSSHAADGDLTEFTRTETDYDSNDRAIVSRHYERHSATGDSLDTTNSVITYNYTWYDMSGRVIATANFGSNSDTFIAGGAPSDYLDPNGIPITSPAEYSVPVDPNDPNEQIVLEGCSGGGFDPNVALCTCYDYDDLGRQTAVWHPDGTITHTEYDDLGRVVLTTENAGGVDDEVRRTAYFYNSETGQLDRMAAVLPDHNGGITSFAEIDPNAIDGTLQVTQFFYDAEVVGAAWIRNAGGAVPIPPGGGSPLPLGGGGLPPVTGVAMQPKSLSVLSHNNSWVSEVRYPHPSTGQPDPNDSVTFTYLSDGQLSQRTDARGVVFTHQYDQQGRRVDTYSDDSDWFDAQPTGTPPDYRIGRISYDYTSDGKIALVTAYYGDGDILTQNQYEYDGFGSLTAEQQAQFDPADPNTPTIGFNWQMSPAANWNYYRVTSMTYPPRPGESTSRAVQFGYGADGGIDSLLNRVAQISETPSDATVSYSYAGLSRRVGVSFGNGVSQNFLLDDEDGYNGLDQFGRTAGLYFKKSGVTVHQYQYGYDPAGNRTHARVTQYGRPNENSFLYGYDALRRLTTSEMGELAADGLSIVKEPNNPAVPIPLKTAWNLDNLGNWAGGDPNNGGMVQSGDFDFDGTADPNRSFHQATDSENAIGEITTTVGGTSETRTIVTDVTGNLTFDGSYWYQYDAWNRMVEVRSAGTLDENDFDANGTLSPAGGHLPGDIVALYIYDGVGRLVRRESPVTGYPQPRVETYLYEGVRRIQERVDSPDGNDSEREYVYGRDYVDEVLFQFDEAGDPFYVLQDANYNVVALLDASGEVVEQYTYSPYGEILAADILDPNTAPLTRIGFQGLFFDRLDVSPDNQRLDPNSFGHYYARNRWYRPDLGRFTTKDVNATALPIMAALTVNAESFNILLGNFSGPDLYGDGTNLYIFAAADPISSRDPSGLWSAEDDRDYDFAADDNTGWRLYVVGTLNEGAEAVGLGLEMSLGIASAILGLDVFESVAVLADGRGGFWDAMDVVLATSPIGRVGKLMSKMRKYKRLAGKSRDAVGSISDLLKLTRRWRTGINPSKLSEAAAKYPKKAGKVERHHIIPKYLGGPNNGPTAPVDAAYHQLITNAFRREWRYANPMGKPDPAKLEVILDKVYGELPLP